MKNQFLILSVLALTIAAQPLALAANCNEKEPSKISALGFVSNEPITSAELKNRRAEYERARAELKAGKSSEADYKREARKYFQ